MTARLPKEKLEKLKSMLKDWINKKKATKRDLLSLIGFLSFACKVVKPGRMFLRRLIDLSTTVKSNNFFVYINAEARADLQWWQDFLPQWNGVEIIQQHPISSNNLRLWTDASDLGFGCLFRDSWVMSEWKHGWGAHHINIRELFAIWVAILTWGDQLRNLQILILTDSLSMTQVWSTGSCKDPVVMKIIRAMFLFCARKNINVLMKHIPGVRNQSADLLSRFQVAKFRQLQPTADSFSTPVPREAWHI